MESKIDLVRGNVSGETYIRRTHSDGRVQLAHLRSWQLAHTRRLLRDARAFPDDMFYWRDAAWGVELTPLPE